MGPADTGTRARTAVIVAYGYVAARTFWGVGSRTLEEMRKLARSDVFDMSLGAGVAKALVVITRRVDTSERSDHLLDSLGYGCAVVAGLSLSLRRRAPAAGLVAAAAAVALYSAGTIRADRCT